MAIERNEHTHKTEKKKKKKKKKKMEYLVFLARLACFGQLCLISNPHIKFQIFRNELNDHKEPENINYTIVKYGETFLRSHHGTKTSCC